MINAIVFYRISRWLYLHRVPIFPRFVTFIIFLIYNSKIPYTAEIGRGSLFAYGGIGVVLHDRVHIGTGCSIGTNVTVGGKSGYLEVPIIGDNVYLSTGSKILGPIVIGNNVIVGANAV